MALKCCYEFPLKTGTIKIKIVIFYIVLIFFFKKAFVTEVFM